MQKRISDYMWTKTMPVLEKEKYKIHDVHQGDMCLHDHAFLELAYIVKGPVKHTLDGQTSILQTGDYVIVDYGSIHSYDTIDKKEFENIDFLFLPELLDSVLKDNINLRSVLEHYLLHFNMQALKENPARMVFHDDDKEILLLLKKIMEEDKERKTGYGKMIRSYLIQILLITMRRIEGAYITTSSHNITSYITSYVSEHYKEEIMLKDLANKMNYSVPYVSKQFKEDMGISFVAYLQNYRVMQGCRLLASTKYTVSEISKLVGYSDEKFFASLVKRTTGYTPFKYRKLKG